MNNAAIIVAGGSGNRMGAAIPKQFLNLRGKPILMHTIQRFYDFDNTIVIILALPEKQIPFWKSLCTEFKFKIPHEITKGGETRFHSVKNGLSVLQGDYLVGIHDGVRPFVSKETIQLCYQIALKKGNAIPVMPMKESVRIKDGNTNTSFDRRKLFVVQTPQVFHLDILFKSFQQGFEITFTDDAKVVESAGYSIHLVNGNPENIKITTTTDLVIGEALINQF